MTEAVYAKKIIWGAMADGLFYFPHQTECLRRHMLASNRLRDGEEPQRLLLERVASLLRAEGHSVTIIPADRL